MDTHTQTNIHMHIHTCTQEGVGLVAVNDSLWIEGTIYKLLRSHFRQEPYYVDIVDLFHEVRLDSFSPLPKN